jgi:hypothetical protein
MSRRETDLGPRQAVFRLGLAGCAAVFSASANAAEHSAGMLGSGSATVSPIVVTGRSTSLVSTAVSANQGVVGARDLALRPLLRPGEIVEAIPGVIITQHSGSGKANQYFLRGFNLDHGTDLAVSAEGAPVNMPSHAHGQGYADLNFVIPELVQRVEFKKGPYYADVGDFGSAGAFNIRTYDRLPSGLIRLEGGQGGYARAVLANNVPIASGNLVYAAEYEHNDGPWKLPDNENKFGGLTRYTLGDTTNGFTLSASAYHNSWRSTDQVPDRAVADGLIGRFGTIDPTDAGVTDREALSADWRWGGAASSSHILVYGLRYQLDLFSNFTYFLDDPVHGDQIEQLDRRWVFGGEASHSWSGLLLGRPSQTTLGLQVRNDDIKNGLYHTEALVRLNAGDVNAITEASIAPFNDNQTRWTDWFRSDVGLRADRYWVDVRNIVGGASGRAQASLLSPKLGLVFGPWRKTEVYLDGGQGFHSNDARGVVSPAAPATALARSTGAEIGVRTSAIPGLESALSLWLLDLTSELVWDGDAGTNTPSGPTRRYGIEFANFYAPTQWLTIDADYAWSHARFTDHEPAGPYVPEALVATFDGGIAIHDLPGWAHSWSGGLRLRYFGPRPLTQDGAIRSRASTLLYADLGYAFRPGWSLGVSVFNLLDAKVSDIDYYYVSRLPGEPLSGVADVHSHPAEPREIRVSLTRRF